MSEADWFIYTACSPDRCETMEMVGQRVLDARIQNAASHIPLLDVFPTVAGLMSASTQSTTQYVMENSRLQERLGPIRAFEEATYGVDGAEQVAFAFDLTREEQYKVLLSAVKAQELAAESLGDFTNPTALDPGDVAELEAEIAANGSESFELTVADEFGVEVAFEVEDNLDDPAVQAYWGEVHFKEALAKQSVTSGIVTAIRDNLHRS